MMALQMDDMPKEVLCKFLELLNTNDKFKVRAVSKKWKDQIDENVSFHVSITDANYNLTKQRFETCRNVKSIWITDYNREDIPIQNLTFLQNLTVRFEVNKLAIADILSRAPNLNFLDFQLSHDKESAKIQQTTGPASYPALRNIKQLNVGYNHLRWISWSGRPWNDFLYGEMPNVQRLHVALFPNVPPLQGFDFFRLAAGMPNLRVFTMQIWPGEDGRQFRLPADVQPLTRDISLRLANLKLTKVSAVLFEKDEQAWEALLAGQSQMKELILSNESNATSGFPVSMIHPVLYKSRESLDTIDLDIDTRRNGDVDVEIFSSLKSLRVLVLKAWSKQDEAPTALLPNVSNCSTVVSESLEKLSVVGFKFTEEDVISCIKNIPNHQLNEVRIGHEFASGCTDFENRLEEMGIVRYGHSSKHLTQHHSAPNSYLGAILELEYEYEWIGLLKKGSKRRIKVKQITIQGTTLIMESHYIWSYK